MSALIFCILLKCKIGVTVVSLVFLCKMDHKSQSFKQAVVTGHHIRENCPRCNHLKKRYCVFFCAVCAIFTFINLVVLIYILGRQNANAESDILNKLHVLQARIENLEAINNRALSVVTELHYDSLELPAKEGSVSPLTEFLGEKRVKRRVKKGHTGKIRHKLKSLDLPAKKGNVSPSPEFLEGRREKRRVKKGHKGRRRQKSKLTTLQVVGFQTEHRPNETLSGTFHKWEYADWFFKLSDQDKKKQFELFFTNGTLQVKQPGLYLLYSQITLKGNGTQGYHVMRNEKDPILACYSNNMMLHEEDMTSCFTMGLFKLDKSDTISLKHVSTSGIRAVFTSNASFFGLVKLGRFNKRGVVLAV